MFGSEVIEQAAILRAQVVTALRDRMRELECSQRDLAFLLGVSESTISMQLNGDANVTLTTLSDIAFALGCSVRVALESAP